MKRLGGQLGNSLNPIDANSPNLVLPVPQSELDAGTVVTGGVKKSIPGLSERSFRRRKSATFNLDWNKRYRFSDKILDSIG